MEKRDDLSTGVSHHYRLLLRLITLGTIYTSVIQANESIEYVYDSMMETTK